MAAPKGHPKWGGRQKGARNSDNAKIDQYVAETGVNVVKILCWVAAGDWKSLKCDPAQITLTQRMSAATEIMSYLYSKRKPAEDVEVPDDGTGAEELTDEELDQD